MESFLVHAENAEQLKIVKAFLKALKIQFESPMTEVLPDHVVESINRGLKQAENGQTISFQEFADKHFRHK